MSHPTQQSALITRSGALWQTVDAAQFARRVQELANALLEVGAPTGGVVALEHAASAEAVTVAVAALDAGLAVRLGPAQPPLAAALVATPARAAALAAEAGIDQVAIPCAATADGAASLERLAAHGVLQTALHPDALAARTAARADDDAAVIAADGAVFRAAQLAAAVAALRAVEDLLRPDEPVLFAVPLAQPWLLAFALAAVAAGAPVAVGALADAQTVRPGVIVASCADVAALPERVASGSRLLGGLARLLGRDRTLPPARCLIVPDGFVEKDLCVDLHLGGTTVLHAVGDRHLLVPAALNQPHRFRLDAYGLPVPHHDARIEDGRLVLDGPLGGPTSIGARLDADGFVVPSA